VTAAAIVRGLVGRGLNKIERISAGFDYLHDPMRPRAISRPEETVSRSSSQ
jgi:hypothetical protein